MLLIFYVLLFHAISAAILQATGQAMGKGNSDQVLNLSRANKKSIEEDDEREDEENDEEDIQEDEDNNDAQDDSHSYEVREKYPFPKADD